MSINEQSISAEKRHYYSSSQGPFHNANNILMFYGGGGRADIVETIIRALRMGDPLITVAGERGSGKTMLSLVLADRLKRRHNNIRYDLPQLTPALMLRHLLIEICPQDADLISHSSAVEGIDRDIIDAALQRLLTAMRLPRPGNKPYLLTVDTPIALDEETLQLLQDLVDAQDSNDPTLQIVIFRRVSSQANIHGVSAANRQQGTDDQYWLRRLTLSEITEYLRHHMMLFDFNQRDVFTREMAYFIADRSEGVFRRINTLARNAFMVAGLEDAERVSMSHLLTAGLPDNAYEVVQPGFVKKNRGVLVGLLGCSMLIALAGLVFLQPF